MWWSTSSYFFSVTFPVQKTKKEMKELKKKLVGRKWVPVACAVLCSLVARMHSSGLLAAAGRRDKLDGNSRRRTWRRRRGRGRNTGEPHPLGEGHPTTAHTLCWVCHAHLTPPPHLHLRAHCLAGQHGKPLGEEGMGEEEFEDDREWYKKEVGEEPDQGGTV